MCDRSQYVRVESECTIGVMMSIGVGMCDQNWDVQPESRCTTGAM
jgi:hypothetical protein